jgi:hypothetical protein
MLKVSAALVSGGLTARRRRERFAVERFAVARRRCRD